MDHRIIVIAKSSEEEEIEKRRQSLLPSGSGGSENIRECSSPSKEKTVTKSSKEIQPQREYDQVQDSVFPQLVTRINRGLVEMRRRNTVVGNLSQSVPIFRLPDAFKSINCKSVEPEIVSIGPYHRGRSHLLEFEEHKWFFLGKFLRRSGRDLNELLLEMEGSEAPTRQCYSDNVLMSKEDFIEMMLLDGCFLIEVLCYLGRDDEVGKDIDDPVLSKPWLIPVLVRDVLKLENQLPLFILKSLFDNSHQFGEKFVRLALEFFNLSWSGPPTTSLRPEFVNSKHLLELFYLSLVPTISVNRGNERQRSYGSTHSMQCVTQLKLSGIKFKPRKAETFLDIKYENQLLLIPTITVNDIMSTVLINCVALEQGQEYNIKYFSNYVSFMNCLISQPKDVASLSSNGIISNISQDDQHVSDLFNNIGENTVYIRDSYLSKQVKDVEAYYNSNWASLMRNYFSTPWSVISVFSAFLLLVLTLIQTIMSLLSYNRGFK